MKSFTVLFMVHLQFEFTFEVITLRKHTEEREKNHEA